MCWNENVSLNTFLFSSFVLLLIIYNNTYTQYKVKEFDDKWKYIFFASFICMQLIEFFIWRNIYNKYYNNIFSISAILLLIIQPIFSLMIITSNIQLRNLMMSFYLLLAIPFSIYSFSTTHVYSTVSKNGHLQWNFFHFPSMDWIIWFIWLFFFLFSFVYEQKWIGISFGLITLLISYINYKNDNSMASMWCWLVNSVMIYYAFYLLLYLPFIEKMDIC